MDSKKKYWLPIFVFTIIVGLIIDQWMQPYGQMIVNVVVILLMAIFLYTEEAQHRKPWIICLILATAGEWLLSDIYQLYDYREGHIPYFVPPGHVMLYAIGLWLVPMLHRTIPWISLVLATTYAGYCYSNGLDQFSLILFGLWLFMFLKKELRGLITVMFLLALAMEILGTGLGNWYWAPEVKILSGAVSQANPPFAVGVLYCGLDFIVGLFSTQKTDVTEKVLTL